MVFEQFYLGCLAHASYLIGSEGVAAVVDPQRDVDQYIDAAQRQGLTIRWVLETHLHADFVSGHRELASRTGAEIVFGAAANAEFPHRAVHDGEEITIGRVTLRVLETPGHTPESVSYLVMDEESGTRPVRVLTGDTLFIGDVGRPDLVGSKGFTPQMMAAELYDSLHQKLLTLPDEVEVYPAHGAGSACGRNISSERSSTIGEQRRHNWALHPMPKEDFVRMLTAELSEPPRYFGMDAEINRRGARPLHEVKAEPLGAQQVNDLLHEGAVALDVRDSASFGTAHLPSSINIGLRGEFASWAGSLLSPDTRVVLIGDGEEQVHEAIMRLARVGLENVIGWLDGGVPAWVDAEFPVEALPQIDVEELRERLRTGEVLQVLDVRRPAEYESGHVPGAAHLPLHQLESLLETVDRSQPTAVICEGGYRSSTGASLALRKGFAAELFNVIGGTSAWAGSGFELERAG